MELLPRFAMLPRGGRNCEETKGEGLLSQIQMTSIDYLECMGTNLLLDEALQSESMPSRARTTHTRTHALFESRKVEFA